MKSGQTFEPSPERSDVAVAFHSSGGVAGGLCVVSTAIAPGVVATTATTAAAAVTSGFFDVDKGMLRNNSLGERGKGNRLLFKL
jgi:hypothetical protein